MNCKMSLKSPKTTPILPPELWNHIFQFLIPNDLFSVITTCPEWNELLKERKKTFLLPLVIPSVMKYVDLNTSLKFRKISKFVKLAVDDTLQSFFNSDDDNPFNFHYEEFSSQRHLRYVALKISSRYKFNPDHYSLFLARVLPDLSTISSNINPFLTCHINFESDFSIEVYLPARNQHVVSILPKFGHQVSSINCNVIGSRSSLLPFSHFVWQLQLVPNLTRLEIQLNLESNHLPCLSTAAYDFPPLPKLAVLDINCENADRQQKSAFIFAILRKYSQQLISFTCRATLFSLPFLNLEVLNTSFPSLKKFHLLASRSEIPPALNKLCNVSWRLEKLHLQDTGQLGVYDEDELNTDDVLSTINNFHRSLVHLELNCQLELTDSNEENDFKSTKEYRQMSRLKILITNPTNLKSKLFKRFLQRSCVSLEHLHFSGLGVDLMMFREEGRWALETIRSLEKVVYWNNFPSRDKPRTYTMRRTKTKSR